MKLLVCGGAGFIGSRFVEYRLASSADDLIVLDKLTYAGGRDNLAAVEADAKLAGRLTFIRGDIADPNVVTSLVKDADAIVDFAAETHVDRSILDPGATARTNVMGVQVLLHALHSAFISDGRMRRMVQVSTDEVYGPAVSGAHSEDARLAPRSPYAATKAAGDLLVLAAHLTYGLDVVITRGANTYGPRQHPEKLVPLFITNALKDRQMPLYGDGQQRRDWLHVDDHASAISRVLDAGDAGSVYNIVAGQERANRDVARGILERLGKPWSLVRQVADRPAHDQRYAMVGERLASLGWRPLTPFEAGLDLTVAWYRANEDWWRRRHGREWDRYYERQYGDRLARGVEA
ncbi:MAG: dTDP-glucose 4,6-dehydratase [Candidatus Limnocylindrales bacterium]